ncbi:alpha/beta fold hydrolase [Dyadobacter tibetensis]|uniref:alpha/beta fold hydrolase n=1 Tax=Dyadobacter tibetensis TaxID=1211851 RepID=UPI0004718D71|nr:alpha/beta fold hydrolase [Dyadobacter tibetensis]
MKTLFIALAASLFAITSSAQNINKPTVVLVHGAWSDVSAWNAVIPLIKAKGIKVMAVNLPGHGNDSTPFTSITLQSYIDAVKNQIGDTKNVILVGHSMAGIVISQVAEEMPSSIHKLVYLAAYLPANGQSLLDIAKTDATSHVGQFLEIDQSAASAGIGKEGAVDIFVADAPKLIQDRFARGVQPDPLVPFASPVTLSEKNFGSIKKVYIHTLNDHAIGYATQQAMVKNTNVESVHTLKSSHSPFITIPDQLAAILISEVH